jgi:PAS domain S-box-containing protein
MQNIVDFFKSDDFMPHGHCFQWQPDILWLHVVSDAMIAVAYYAIPLAILYFVRHRKDLPFKSLFLLFAAFIVLCGTTHLMSIWVLWYPDYALEGVIKALTAAASICSFIVMVKLMPMALRLVTPENLDMGRLALRLQGSESRLQAVMNHTLDGIIIINSRGIIETFNPACERIFGYTEEEVVGQNVSMLMPEPYHSQHDDYIRNYAETGEAKIIGTAGRELTARRKGGATFPIDLSISAFRLEDGQYFSGIIRDITARKAAEAQLLHYMRQLELSNRELDDFAYIASHDLKEPLRGLTIQANFLIDDFKDKLGPEGHRRLVRMTEISHRMDRLINDLLYFSRLGRTELAVQETDPNILIGEIKQMMETTLRERNARVVIPQPLPQIVCDKPRLAEVFRNLITNAVKYNDKREPLIEIGFIESLQGPNGAVRDVFYVKDNGIGIDKKYHHEVFRIFKRIVTTPEEKEPGTGVGLTFVKRIVERHGGGIWLESEPGMGTTFYFTLGKRKQT